MGAFRAFLVGIILAATTQAEQPTQAPRIGDPAPALATLKIVQGPVDSVHQLALLAGRVTVLEFWATWCAPCVAAIPHLNKLAEKFESRGAIFISISDEPEAALRQFLEKDPIRTWVAQDDGQHVARAYSVEAVPTTIIIDRNARIAGIANPEQVTDEVLQRVLNGEPAGLPPWETRLIRPGEDPGAPSSGGKRPLFRLEIRFGDNPYRASLASGKGKFTADSVDAISLLINAFQISPTRILNRELLPSWHYTVVASAPEGNESLLRAMLQQALPAALGVSVVREEREMDVFLLKAPKGPGPGLRKGSRGGHMSSRPGLYVGQGEPLSALASLLEGSFKRPIVDETNLVGNWDWDVSYTAGDPASLERALKSLGLELAPARRKVSVLVIQKQAS